MSCSKITEKSDEEQEDEEADDTLVVVVKPDGTVAIDQDTFNRVLGEKYTIIKKKANYIMSHQQMNFNSFSRLTFYEICIYNHY